MAHVLKHQPVLEISFLFLCISSLAGIEAAVFSDVHWSTAIKLSEYVSYRSVTLLSYEIPEQTDQVTFTFEARIAGSSCTFREVHVCFQHGSYPLVNPYNATYPENFQLNRTDAFNISIKESGETVSYLLTSPRPGMWYFAAFLPKKDSDRIGIKAWEKHCMYGMFIVVAAQGVDNIKTIPTESANSIELRQVVYENQALVRYKLPMETVSYNIEISHCYTEFLESEDEDNSTVSIPPGFQNTSCPLVLVLESDMLPSQRSQLRIECSNQTRCGKEILSPSLAGWSYMLIKMNSLYNVSEIQFKLRIKTKACEPFKFMIPKSIFYDTIPRHRDLTMDLPQDSCIKIDSLGRYRYDGTFNVTFLLTGKGPIPEPVTLHDIYARDTMVLVTDFRIEPSKDLGGTLRSYIKLVTDPDIFERVGQVAVVHVCLMRSSIPGGKTVRACAGGVGLTLNSSRVLSDIAYVPYPEAGTWFVAISSQCFRNTSREITRCVQEPVINLELGLSGCVDSSCGDYGRCQEYISGVHVFSSCYCFAGWRGYGCTDGLEGRSKQEELVATLLLSLSNLFFLPAICLATYRKFYVEAVVYLYTMFFSGFYHACDTSDLVYYCMFKYDALSFSDFLGSITSFWVTMLAMADLPQGFKSAAQMLGALGVAFAVEYDRQGILEFAIPACLAAAIMLASWIWQCRKRRKLYPNKNYWLIHFLPGVALAGTGLILFAFFETTENYKYTHSVWHICMSTCIVFLLPKTKRKDPNPEGASALSSSITLEEADPSINE